MSFKVAILFLPLALLGREQVVAIDIAVLPINFSGPGSEMPHPSKETWADRPGGGKPST